MVEKQNHPENFNPVSVREALEARRDFSLLGEWDDPGNEVRMANLATPCRFFRNSCFTGPTPSPVLHLTGGICASQQIPEFLPLNFIR